MAKPTLELDAISIVLLGSFNPLIFQPAWFAAEGLVPSEEIDSDHVTVEMIHPQVCAFSTEWFTIEVTPDRLVAFTSNAEFRDPLYDLVLSTFRLLRFTPIGAMGLNTDQHYRVPSEDAWHAVGHHFAPAENWTSVLAKPGMRSLTMEGVRPDKHLGHVRVKVEPSVRIHPGVFIEVNEHFVAPDPETTKGGEHIMAILEQVWPSTGERASKVVEEVLRVARD